MKKLYEILPNLSKECDNLGHLSHALLLGAQTGLMEAPLQVGIAKSIVLSLPLSQSRAPVSFKKE